MIGLARRSWAGMVVSLTARLSWPSLSESNQIISGTIINIGAAGDHRLRLQDLNRKANAVGPANSRSTRFRKA